MSFRRIRPQRHPDPNQHAVDVLPPRPLFAYQTRCGVQGDLSLPAHARAAERRRFYRGQRSQEPNQNLARKLMAHNTNRCARHATNDRSLGLRSRTSTPSAAIAQPRMASPSTPRPTSRARPSPAPRAGSVLARQSAVSGLRGSKALFVQPRAKNSFVADFRRLQGVPGFRVSPARAAQKHGCERFVLCRWAAGKPFSQ